MRHHLRTRPFIAPMLTTRRRFAAVIFLLAVTVFGATVQAGLLAPKFRSEGAGGDGQSLFYGTIVNVSWRSWTMSDPRLADGRQGAPFERSRKVVARLYRSEPFTSRTEGHGPAVRHLVLQPDQSVLLGVEVRGGGCPAGNTTAPSPGATSSSWPLHAVTVRATVATPLGSRTIHETFEVSCLL